VTHFWPHDVNAVADAAAAGLLGLLVSTIKSTGHCIQKYH